MAGLRVTFDSVAGSKIPTPNDRKNRTTDAVAIGTVYSTVRLLSSQNKLQCP